MESGPGAEPLVLSLESVLSKRLGPSIGVAVELIGADGGLWPEELAIIADAVPARRAAFAAGRHCAQRALWVVGCAPCPIGRGQWHEPRWPDGFIGSISHDGCFAVAIAQNIVGLRKAHAIDLVADPDSDVFGEIRDVIATPVEAGVIGPGVFGLARLFSAKEAAIKLISPPYRRFIEFRDLVATPLGPGFRIRHRPTGVEVRTWDARVGTVLVTIASRGRCGARP
jgi:4'-phosphopantetheinyl transferase EntD